MKIAWNDITVDNADELKDFYSEVFGFKSISVPMEGYNDYIMVESNDPDSPIGGICHKKGVNSDMPGGWIPYVEVSELESILLKVKANGGKIVDGPRIAGEGEIAIIKDISGGFMGLYSK
jgi:predicted enzyme related to lactoylglutathione lyase